MSYLGIDIGTSSIKVSLINAQQQLLATKSINIPIQRPNPLYSEQNPEDWWNAVVTAIDYLQNNYANQWQHLKSIGITGQQHGAVCLDKNGAVVYPAILWNDGRSYQEAQFLNSNYADFLHINGNLVLPGFTAPKIFWLQKHKPEIYQQVSTILLPKDYIRYRLTGEYASDLSDASGTSWLDVKNRKWSEKLLQICQLDISYMPKLYEGTAISGYLHSNLQHAWGIKNSVTVVGGGGDNAAGAVSVGVICHGKAMLSLGTSGVYFIAQDSYLPMDNGISHSFCHCIPQMWHHMGVILSAASCLSWLSLISSKAEHKLIANAQTQRYDADATPLFLPYLSGERTPHNNPFARGMFFGITHTTQLKDLTNAVLEGVAYAIKDCEEILPNTKQVESLAIIGGGAKSNYWGQIIANVLNKTIVFYDETKIGPSFGAALLALAGDNGINVSDLEINPLIIKEINPQPQLINFYQQKHEKFKALYQQTKNLNNLNL
ncbi:MAG: xylulokinase [Burkholderiales bacterium]|nr:xylulokinase [Burkholderiales bacterium]